MPKRMEACVEILAEYPTVLAPFDPDDYLPALNAIDKALERMERTQPPVNCARRLRSRTELYAMAVKEWPVEDLKFVPNPAKWYAEARYDQPSESWQRQPVNDYVQGRQQLGRVFDELAKTGNGGQRVN